MSTFSNECEQKAIKGCKVVKGVSTFFLPHSIEYLTSKEIDVINLIKNSKYGDIYKFVLEANKVNVSLEEPKDVYYVHHGAKVRYIDPLVNGERISNICKIAKRYIDNNLAYEMNDKYLYLDFKLN